MKDIFFLHNSVCILQNVLRDNYFNMFFLLDENQVIENELWTLQVLTPLHPALMYPSQCFECARARAKCEKEMFMGASTGL